MLNLRLLLERYSQGHGRALLIYSLVANVAILAPSFHMLQVYDRVLNSGSLSTLLYLTLITIFVLVVYGVAENARARICQRLSASYAISLSPKLFARAATASDPATSAKMLRDFQMVRQFIGGKGLTSLFDLPFIPLYLLLLLMMHWAMAALTIAGIGVMVVLNWLGNNAVVADREKNRNAENAATGFSHNTISHADDVVALGLLPNFISIWNTRINGAVESSEQLSRNSAGYVAASKSFRQMLQIASMALGAFLVLEGQMSAGMIVLASMISGKALGPLDQLIGGWDGLLKTGTAFREIEEFTGADKQLSMRADLPAPTGLLEVAALGFHDGEDEKRRTLLDNVSFKVEPGKLMVITGATASGKSLLARCLVGAVKPQVGSILLDKAAKDQWPARQWGAAFGYVSQTPEMLPGTVAANIARFEAQIDPKLVYECAVRAGAHEAILALPDGYGTVVGSGGYRLSCGQKQRIVLARALYGDPKVLVLDQPGSQLDPKGEGALVNCLLDAKRRGMAIIVFSSKRSIFQIADKGLEMNAGRVEELDLDDIRRMGQAFKSAMSEPSPVAATAAPNAMEVAS